MTNPALSEIMEQISQQAMPDPRFVVLVTEIERQASEIERLRQAQAGSLAACMDLADDALKAEIERLRWIEDAATGVAAEILADLPHKCLVCAIPDGEHVDGCPVPALLAALNEKEPHADA